MDTNRNYDDLYMFIAERIKDLRKNKNLSQDKFAEHVNLSRVSIANIEVGNQKPTLSLIWKLSSAFAVGINYFFPSDEDILKAKGKTESVSFLKDLQESL